MLSERQKNFIRSLFPAQDLIEDKCNLMAYSQDSSELFGQPDLVVCPTCISQIQKLLQFAYAEQIPIIPRGSGTGRVGGSVPGLEGGIVLSLLKLNKILEIRAQDFVAVVEPGVITGNLQKVLATQNLFYPPDPASSDYCTLGGNVATNAGGMQALKYGVTANYVLGLEVVLANGELLDLKNYCHKNATGLNLSQLFVGSEGILGIITKIYLKLLPLPESSGTLLAGFSSLDELNQGLSRFWQSNLFPCALELIDHNALKAISQINALPWNKENEIKVLLLIKFDGSESSVCEQLQESQNTLKPFFHLTKTGAEQDKLWEIRKKISPAALKLKPAKISEDFTLPRSRLGEFLLFGQELSARYLPILIFGHLGDGNLHVNILYDPKDKIERLKAKEVHTRLLDKTLELQGTISGEHGIGKKKKKYLSKQLSPKVLAVSKQLKLTLDPKNILNPGKAI